MRLPGYILSVLMTAGVLVGLARCDAVQPGEEDRLVVEGFLDAGRPLPRLRLRHTEALDVPYGDDASTAVTDAALVLTLDGHAVIYDPVPADPGYYEAAAAGERVPPLATFGVEARWRDQHAEVHGSIPPPVTLDSVRVDVPPAPVQAVLLDSLVFTDSTGVGAREGYIYPVEVTLWWTPDHAAQAADSRYWIQTSLRPFIPFSSTVVDFFLRPRQILPEDEMAAAGGGRRKWTGVYAVLVEHESDPMPDHRLTVALLRGGKDYAQFATSSDDPQRREPISNVEGALGIIAGISVDSLQINVHR